MATFTAVISRVRSFGALELRWRCHRTDKAQALTEIHACGFDPQPPLQRRGAADSATRRTEAWAEAASEIAALGCYDGTKSDGLFPARRQASRIEGLFGRNTAST